MEELVLWAEKTIQFSIYCKEAAKERFRRDIISFIHRVKFYDQIHFEANYKKDHLGKLLILYFILILKPYMK